MRILELKRGTFNKAFCLKVCKCACLSLKHERWHSEFDPKMASLLSELELGLGSLVRQSGAPASRKNCLRLEEENVLGRSF